MQKTFRTMKDELKTDILRSMRDMMQQQVATKLGFGLGQQIGSAGASARSGKHSSPMAEPNEYGLSPNIGVPKGRKRSIAPEELHSRMKTYEEDTISLHRGES